MWTRWETLAFAILLLIAFMAFGSPIIIKLDLHEGFWQWDWAGFIGGLLATLAAIGTAAFVHVTALRAEKARTLREAISVWFEYVDYFAGAQKYLQWCMEYIEKDMESDFIAAHRLRREASHNIRKLFASAPSHLYFASIPGMLKKMTLYFEAENELDTARKSLGNKAYEIHGPKLVKMIESLGMISVTLSQTRLKSIGVDWVAKETFKHLFGEK